MLFRSVYMLFPICYLALKMKWYRKQLLTISIGAWVIFFLFSFPFLFGISYPFWMNRVINVVYAIPIALVVYGKMEEKRGNNFYKQLLTLMRYLVGFYLIFIAISFFVSPRIFHAMSIIWREALSFYPGPLIFSTFKVLLFVLFIIAVWDILEIGRAHV